MKVKVVVPQNHCKVLSDHFNVRADDCNVPVNHFNNRRRVVYDPVGFIFNSSPYKYIRPAVYNDALDLKRSWANLNQHPPRLN